MDELTQLKQITNPTLSDYKHAVTAINSHLNTQFTAQCDISHLLQQRSQFLDELLSILWRNEGLNSHSQLILLALGGYGRQEMFPYSDLDLAIIYKEPPQTIVEEQIAAFIRLLWDIGLKLGTYVGSFDAALSQAKIDCDFYTSFLEMRLLTGDMAYYHALPLEKIIQSWSLAVFFVVKQKEQQKRYQQYTAPLSSIESNVKMSPGGLRDFQLLRWLLLRHSGTPSFKQLAILRLCSAEITSQLDDDYQWLCLVRYACHTISQRPDNRLSEELLPHLAEFFSTNVTGFLQSYYRITRTNQETHRWLCQAFFEEFVREPPLSCEPAISINATWQIRSNQLELIYPIKELTAPYPIFNWFLFWATHTPILNFTAKTIATLYALSRNLPTSFGLSTTHCADFLTLCFALPGQLGKVLQTLQQFQILEKYLPEFARITHLPQYDGFHAYTVDEHTLKLLRELDFIWSNQNNEFLFCSTIIKQLANPASLYFSGLFHDLGKGSGQDHAVYGAQLAEHFCQRHNLSAESTALITWLVKAHLLMSHTAQRKDIYDPVVIAEFAAQLPQPNYLDYLYLLTIADIRATNPKLWNSWKDSLLKTLYLATKAYFSSQTSPQKVSEQTIQNKQEMISKELAQQISAEHIIELFAQLDTGYFLRHSPENITRHLQAILAHGSCDEPLILLQTHHSLAGTELLVYIKDRPYLFATITAVIDQLRLVIVDAAILTTTAGYALDTFIILDENQQPLQDEILGHTLQQQLRQALIQKIIPKIARRRIAAPRIRFDLSIELSFTTEPHTNRTVMALVTTDRAGLLAQIGQALVECAVELHFAKITTLNQKVADWFYLSQNQQPLNKITQEKVQNAIKERYKTLV